LKVEAAGYDRRMQRVLLLTTARSYRNEAFRTAAARAGVEVVVAYDLPRAMQEAGHPQQPGWLGVELADPAAAAETVAAYAQEQPLAAVLPVDDSGVVAAAAMAARLGLPYNAPAAAEAARDKFRMRTLMAGAGVPCPWFRRFSTADDPARVAAEVPYPCVVKPTSLNGSRGVMRADDPAEFAGRVERLARMLAREYGPGPQPFLVESFLPGVEVALEGMLDQGELTVLALFDKPDPLDGPFFEETIYVTPSRRAGEVQAAIAACAGRAAAAIGLQTGPVHAELRVNEAGPWMLEIAGRSIGGLCGRTLRFDYGDGEMALEELIVRQACGLPWRAPAGAAADPGASGVVMIPIPEAGQLRAVEGVAEAAVVAGIEGVEMSVALHHMVTPLPEGEAYLGFIFARGETPGAVEAALREAHGKLRFTIVPEIGLLV
jgi:biotin carboxylase